jgi:hypothetical protein
VPRENARRENASREETFSEHALGGNAPAAEVPAPSPGEDEPAATAVSGPGEVVGAAARRKTKTRRTDAERGLRGIVGAGPSQVGVIGAMRARDAARPSAQELADAERDVVIVRRHYVPPDNLPGARPPS